MRSPGIASAVVALAIVVGGCSSPAGPPAEEAVDPAWRTAVLTDVRSGEAFRLADLVGRLVAIETMAIWCTNCRIQQSEAAVAIRDVANPDLVFISLDVDPHERPEDLAAYADRQGFDWRFVVASREVARSLADAFGDQVLSPPATPVILIGRNGKVIEQHIGIRGAKDLADRFREHLS